MVERSNPAVRQVKALLWLYFWLLIFEGVLRKWVFPGLSEAIFLVRDPIALLAYALAFRGGIFRWRPALALVFAMAALSLIFSLSTNSRFAVTIFGVRTDFLHLPLIFLMGGVLDRDDVVRFGRSFLWSSVPILILMVKQFNAPPGDILNIGAHGSGSGQLAAIGGKIRPPGPFSFISGVDAYFTLVAAFVFYGWLQPKAFNRGVLIAATIATVVSVPISISRSLLVGTLIVTGFGLVVVVKDPKRIPRFLGPLVATGGFLIFAADTVYVQTFVDRWNYSASFSGSVYSSIFGRIFDQLLQPFSIASQTPLLGHGIGLGTVAGARLTTGEYDFLLAESELARCILELGPILGFAFIGWRFWLALRLVTESWRCFLEQADPLAWLIVGGTFVSVIVGQWGPSTTLGFCIFGAGLAMGALNAPDRVADFELGNDSEEPLNSSEQAQ